MMRMSEVARLVSGAEPLCIRYQYRGSNGRIVMPIAAVEAALHAFTRGLPGALLSRGSERTLRMARVAAEVREAFGEE
ncbi:MAG: hypothetical protein AAFV53_34775 [Myxococcota bacterium]